MLCFRPLYAIVLTSVVYDASVCVCVCARARTCVCVVVLVIVHWHCSAQLSMFNMEKRYRNKIIIITINIRKKSVSQNLRNGDTSTTCINRSVMCMHVNVYTDDYSKVRGQLGFLTHVVEHIFGHARASWGPSAQTVRGAATLRQTLRIKLAMSPNHSLLLL